MLLYRFHLGVPMETFLEKVSDIVGLPSGFTLYPAAGYYKSQLEESTVLEIVADPFPSSLPMLIGELQRVLGQESVLVTRQSVATLFDP